MVTDFTTSQDVGPALPARKQMDKIDQNPSSKGSYLSFSLSLVGFTGNVGKYSITTKDDCQITIALADSRLTLVAAVIVKL